MSDEAAEELDWSSHEEEGFDTDDSDSSQSSQDEYSCGIDWRIEELHPHCCVESSTDQRRMEKKLRWDPHSLNRAQESENQDLPLQVAIYCQHLRCVRFLIDEGADVDRENYEGVKPIEKAMDSACVAPSFFSSLKAKKIIEVLLQNGANINYDGRDYQSTHFLSLIMKNICDIDLLKLFLEYGAETEDFQAIRQGSLYYETPLHCAMSSYDPSICKLLFIHGAILNIHKLPQSSHYMRLYKPILHNLLDNFTSKLGSDSVQMLKLYREFGGDFNLKYHGKTALEVLRTKFDPGTEWFGFDEMLEEFTLNPLSLLSLSRLVIRKAMGRDYKSNIKHLSIPKALKKTLKFKFD